MWLFNKKSKIVSKFKIGDFVSFHYNNDLKYGVIKKIYEKDGIYYDINVGGEASWICHDVAEDQIVVIDSIGKK